VWLPFVCWGMWADPAHAHGGPHLVFVEPPARPVVDDDAHHGALAHDGQADDAMPAGAARPATSLMPFLLLAALTAYVSRWPVRRGARLQHAYPTHSAHLAVPTPPPRLHRATPHTITDSFALPRWNRKGLS